MRHGIQQALEPAQVALRQMLIAEAVQLPGLAGLVEAEALGVGHF